MFCEMVDFLHLTHAKPDIVRPTCILFRSCNPTCNPTCDPRGPTRPLCSKTRRLPVRLCRTSASRPFRSTRNAGSISAEAPAKRRPRRLRHCRRARFGDAALRQRPANEGVAMTGNSTRGRSGDEASRLLLRRVRLPRAVARKPRESSSVSTAAQRRERLSVPRGGGCRPEA